MALNGFGNVQKSDTKQLKNESVSDVVQKDTNESLAKTIKTDKKTNLSKHPKVPQKRVEKQAVTTGTTGIYRNIPSTVMNAIRAEFPDATNHTDALMAFFACYGKGLVAERANANLTEVQQELVKNWDGDSYSAIVKQLEQLVARFDTVAKTTEVIELLSTYMVYDRLGFRNDNPRMPKETNLREDGVMDLVVVAEEQAVGFQYEKRTIQGRPIRK